MLSSGVDDHGNKTKLSCMNKLPALQSAKHLLEKGEWFRDWLFKQPLIINLFCTDSKVWEKRE